MGADKILVVDDESNIRVVFAKCLGDAGYSVTAAADGASALAALAQESFAVVILDMKLPDIDGLEVLQRIKTAVPSQRVIIATAHGSIETAVEAMKRGAVDYLQKPVTPDEFRQAVSRNLAPLTDTVITSEDSFAGCIAAARKLLEERRLEEALPVIHKAIKLDADRPESFNLLGALDELRGDQDAARRMYRVAMTIDATYSPASFNLDRICQWKSVGRTNPINLGDQPKKELSLRDLIV